MSTYKKSPNFFLNVLQLKNHNFKSSAICYKNRFLSQKISLNRKLVSFFIYNGNLKTSSLIFDSFYVNFCRKLNDLNVSKEYDIINSFLIKNPDFIKLYNSSLMFNDLGRLYMFKCLDLIPNVKMTSILKKQKKTKKTKKTKKYTIEYRLIKPATRLQVLNRWCSLLIRVESTKLKKSLVNILPEILINTKFSKLFYLRQKIYNGLSFD